VILKERFDIIVRQKPVHGLFVFISVRFLAKINQFTIDFIRDDAFVLTHILLEAIRDFITSAVK